MTQVSFSRAARLRASVIEKPRYLGPPVPVDSDGFDTDRKHCVAYVGDEETDTIRSAGLRTAKPGRFITCV